MNIPVFDKKKKEYLDFLYGRIRKSYCAEFWDCGDCPYYEPKNPTRECTNACEDAEYIDIECYREPGLDKYYKKGKKEMDWNDEADRIALCKNGWACVEECDYKNCPATKWCHRYQDEKDGERDG